jgi:hypothetical protein
MNLGLNTNVRRVKFIYDILRLYFGYEWKLYILSDLLSQRTLLSFMTSYIVHVFANGVGFICGLKAADLMELPQISAADTKTSLTDSRM